MQASDWSEMDNSVIIVQKAFDQLRDFVDKNGLVVVQQKFWLVRTTWNPKRRQWEDDKNYGLHIRSALLKVNSSNIYIRRSRICTPDGNPYFKQRLYCKFSFELVDLRTSGFSWRWEQLRTSSDIDSIPICYSLFNSNISDESNATVKSVKQI